MADFINDIIQFLLPHNDIYLYIFLFISAVVENLFPPIPGDTITAFGAFLVGTGRLDFFLVYVSTTLGSVIGFMSLFFIGKKLSRDYFIKKDYKFFSAESIMAAESWFEKYGFFVVLGNRFLPGIRSVISIVSGISGLRTSWVVLLSLASASVWNIIWIYAGYILGNNWEVVKEKIGHLIRTYNIIVGILIGIIIIGIIFYKWHGKKTEREKEI